MTCYDMLCYVAVCYVILCYVTPSYVMSVTLLSLSCHFAIGGMSSTPEPRQINCSAQGRLYPMPARISTGWAKANGFLGARPVIPNAPSPEVCTTPWLQTLPIVPHLLPGSVNCLLRLSDFRHGPLAEGVDGL